jgi:U3 small nucleolar RNA-associated protein 14
MKKYRYLLEETYKLRSTWNEKLLNYKEGDIPNREEIEKYIKKIDKFIQKIFQENK